MVDMPAIRYMKLMLWLLTQGAMALCCICYISAPLQLAQVADKVWMVTTDQPATVDEGLFGRGIGLHPLHIACVMIGMHLYARA